MNSPSAEQNGRMIRDEPGRGQVEIFPLPAEEQPLFALLSDLFTNHWHEIVFGPLVPGAAFEIRAPAAPARMTLNNCYLTVDFGPWHFHVCLGLYRREGASDGENDILALSKTHRAEFYRMLTPGGGARSWGIRLYNGHGDQQMSVLFPNPFVTPEGRLAATPDWSRLAMWNDFRRRYLGLEADAYDRCG